MNNTYLKKQGWILTIILLLTLNSMVSAQVDQSLENLRNVIPPSPNASALGRYAEWPVSLYTGVPNISIPIYELKGRSIKVPIDISYHAAGNRVGDIASWVGLGWSLNAGGVISRSVRGLPDEDSYFTYANTYSNPNDFASASNITGGFQKHRVDAANQNGDSQQDLYTLSAMGRSYRLLLKADGSVVTMPYSNINVTYTMPSSWTVTLEDGTVLVFGGGSNFTETNDNSRYGNNAGGIPYTSSWYLQTITSPVGEVINFSYSQTTIKQDTHFTESDWIQYKTGGNVTPGFCTLLTNSPASSLRAENQTVTALSLTTIESNLTRIDFIPSSTARTDLNGGVALSEIKVFSKLANKYIDDYLFNYTYSQAVSGNEYITNVSQADIPYFHNRLKLMSLKRMALDNSAFQLWSFQYNPQNLPSRRSFAQDHSGFFNGATTNTTLLPQIYFVLPSASYWPTSWLYNSGFTPTNNHSLGGVRDFNEANMQAEILTQITYPTGGYTKFNYQANSVPTSGEQFTTATMNPVLNVTPNQTTTTQSSTFTITKPQYVQLQLSSVISSSIMADQPGAKAFVSILDSNGNIIGSIPSSGSNYSGSSYFNLLSAGTYTLKVFTNVDASSFTNSQDYVNINATLTYTQSLGTQSFNQMVGGLRVSSILNYDGVNPQPINDRYFSYTSEFVINPIDVQNDYITTQNSSNVNASSAEECDYIKIIRNASTKYSLGSVQGGAIGYGNVTTLFGPGGTNGKTVSAFSNAADFGIDQSKKFPYPPTDPREWQRGLLLDQTDYNASQYKVKEISNTYTFVPKDKVSNFAAGYSTLVDPALCTDDYHYCGITATSFNISSEQVQHNSSTETSYNSIGTEPVATTTNYYYDNAANMQPVRTVSTNSKGETITNYNRTALEKSDINSSIPLTTAASAAIDAMLSRNMVGPAVESEKYVNGVITRKLLVNYQSFNTNILPQEIESQDGNNPIQSRLLLNYDNNGNLVEQQKAGGGPLDDYIWDYGLNYPIASVTNGTLPEIAYTSFEADGTGNWTIPSSTRDATHAITGNRSYVLSNGNISKTGLSTAQTYVVSYWTLNSVPYTIAGTITGYPVKGATNKGWTYYEHRITGQAAVTISGGGNIDELRLYPLGAQMTTYTYDPLIGMTGSADATGKITYYEYDSLQRLINIKDKDGNIVKHTEYHYQGQ